MTETKIAKELMKELDKRINISNIVRGKAKLESYHYIEIIRTEISAQLEANKRFLEFLRSMQNWASWERMSTFAQENVEARISDLQQAIKILEGKGEK